MKYKFIYLLYFINLKLMKKQNDVFNNIEELI